MLFAVRSVVRFLALVGLGGVGAASVHCGGAAAPATVVEIPKTPRRPDGVMLDPVSAMPRATDRAEARGVVALREPAADAALIRIVRELISAFERKDRDALHATLELATQLDAHGNGSRESLLAILDQRLRNFDYAKLMGSEVFRPDQVERFEYDDLDGPAEPHRPGEMRAGDILVRVPILTPRVGGDRLFGDVVELLLRREGEVLKIVGFGEQDAR